MKFILNKFGSYFFVIFLLIAIYLIYDYINLSLSNYNKAGLYVRISGDKNQPKYLENVYSLNKKIIKYYDENKTLINSLDGDCSYLTNKCNAVHNIKKSTSECKRLFYNSKNSISICKGFAEEKHGKYNVGYKSIHSYYTIDNITYYENTYYFNDDSISSAIYKKIQN